MGKALQVLQDRYASWERCCMFYRKGTQDGKSVACLTRGVRELGKTILSQNKDGRRSHINRLPS